MKRAEDYAWGLRAYRLARGRAVAVEAAAAGVDESTWWRWERARVKPPQLALDAVAHRWGVEVADLLRRPVDGPDAAVRTLVDEHGNEGVAAAYGRVCGKGAL